jgi:hypothetical protein
LIVPAPLFVTSMPVPVVVAAPVTLVAVPGSLTVRLPETRFRRTPCAALLAL